MVPFRENDVGRDMKLCRSEQSTECTSRSHARIGFWFCYSVLQRLARFVVCCVLDEAPARHGDGEYKSMTVSSTVLCKMEHPFLTNHVFLNCCRTV